MEEYQGQIRELQEKLERMQEEMKKKEASAADPQQIRDLEEKLLDAQRHNESLSNELEHTQRDHESVLATTVKNHENVLESTRRDHEDLLETTRRNHEDQLEATRSHHEDESRSLRGELEDLRLNSNSNSNNNNRGGDSDEELQREIDELRTALRAQQDTTEEVRREAHEFLHEMRILSQDSSKTHERQLELERTVEQMEQEIRDWRNRYARAKTQLRSMRASVIGVPSEQSKLIREKGFTDEAGMIKDVHVTKFQLAIDELLQTARSDDPERIMQTMKLVVVAIRSVTKDIDESTTQDQDLVQQKSKLKGRLASAANNLITASKNYAVGAGISPVSIVDAAASNLSAALVELLRVLKIRPTPAEELDDDAETLTSVDSTGMFSAGSAPTIHEHQSNGLPPPPAFQGLGGMRASAGSSAYSPISSPRHSTSRRITNTNGMSNGGGYATYNKGLSPGYGHHDETIDPSDPSYWE